MRVVSVTVIVLLACAATVISLFPHGFVHAIGVDTQSSDEYAFFSGFGAWLSSTLGLSAIVLALWRHLGCHADACTRIGRFHVAGGVYRVCRKHYDEITGHHGPLSVRSLREHHHLHLGHRRTIPDTPGPGNPDNPPDQEIAPDRTTPDNGG